MRRPKGTALVNAADLANTAGVWGDGHGCHGDVSTLTGPLTNLTGNLSTLDGHVHENLVGDASHLRGNITGLYGRIPNLQGDYAFEGHGGNVALLDIFDELSGLDRLFERPIEEEALCFLAVWYLDEESNDYDPQTFESEVGHWGLQNLLVEHYRVIEKSEEVTIPRDILARFLA